MASVIPLGRLQQPAEIAEMVCFLAGPTGDYVTGTTIVMDGGLDVSGPSPLA
jgi:NAD(P)-dependent dehydrogenase (short-subunit alcohol dehydrogenase family)